MTAGAISGADDSCLPKIHYFGEVSSTFDVAYSLYEQDRLAVWDSVIAKKQSEGRGQMRRRWDSPPGNLYATIRLPLAAPFDSTAAAVAVSAICANSLRSFGCSALLKWPNDVVVKKNGAYGKLGGILLEERQKCLLAGIGININTIPPQDALRHGAALAAADLAESLKGQPVPSAIQLWQALVRHLFSVYKNKAVFAQIWRSLADDLLLWKGQKVNILDGELVNTGILEGVSEDGAAVLNVAGEKCNFLNGSMNVAEE